MFRLLARLYRTRLLTPAGVSRLLEALLTTGVNLMALLRIAARLHPRQVAVVDENHRLTYAELWQQAETLARALKADYGLKPRQKVAIVCRNHACAVKSIFAASRLGAHVFLVNPEMSPDQILALEESFRFDFYIHDETIAGAFAEPEMQQKSLPAYHPTENSADRLSLENRAGKERIRRVPMGSIVVMTGGTTGRPKAAGRKPSVLNFLPPFVALLTRLPLDVHQKVYVATPISHGFGLASLFIGVVLGAEMHLARRFEAARDCALIAEHRIDVITLVPVMLQRMLAHDPASLSSLRCIITGGALLSPALTQETLGQLGPILFNLYGTSEAGFCIMATPQLLSRKPDSIGKPVRGVRAKMVDGADQVLGEKAIGRLCIRSAWTVNRSSWIETGDLACRDADGDIFLAGRVDDMIVSGGENVYPVELENVLTQHPQVDSAAVLGIPDPEFGQRLKAVVVKKKDADLDAPALFEWLKPRIARYQMPAAIEFRDHLPYTAIGKVNKKALDDRQV